MAEIYLASQAAMAGFEKEVVLKQLLPEYTARPEFRDLFFREAKISATLDHANIVHVFDLGREDGRLFIAMEYVEGFDLNDLLKRCSRAKVPLPFELAVHVIRDAGECFVLCGGRQQHWTRLSHGREGNT